MFAQLPHALPTRSQSIDPALPTTTPAWTPTPAIGISDPGGAPKTFVQKMLPQQLSLTQEGTTGRLEGTDDDEFVDHIEYRPRRRTDPVYHLTVDWTYLGSGGVERQGEAWSTEVVVAGRDRERVDEGVPAGTKAPRNVSSRPQNCE